MGKIYKDFVRNINPYGYLAHLGLYNKVSDEKYIERAFRYMMGYKINLSAPKTFNEKLQWLKLYDRRPEYIKMVDKYEVKKYVAECIGEEYIIPTLGVWSSYDSIEFDKLPNQFVLKCTHDSGGLVLVKDKKEMNKNLIKRKIKKCFRRNYFWVGREWPYKDVKPRIIIEKYMEEDGHTPFDYKIFCFNGEPKVVLVCRDRFTEAGLTEDFYSEKWEHLQVRRPTHPNANEIIKKPKELEEMLRLAKVLAEDIPFVRVDFYTIEGKVYFGELTFYPASGFNGFEPKEYDEIFGEWLQLPVGN